MRKLVRIFIYLFVIGGAYYFFKWVRSDRDHKEKTEHHEVYSDTDGRGQSLAASEVVSLDAFDQLSIHGAYEVHLTQGDGFTLEAKGKQDDLESLKYYVDGDKLVITSQEGTWKLKDDIDLYISTQSLEKITVSGGVKLESENTLESPFLGIEVSGAADLDLSVAVDDLKMGLSGAANAELEGSAESASYSVSGAGHIDADDLETSEVKISLSGAAAADVFATESLDVRISGAGAVTYKGNPSDVSKSISGLGSVSKK
ncbi:MAG: head GIN domain-containing protein [Bacteroidota bacterium]